jgi:hypothetical protein
MLLVFCLTFQLRIELVDSGRMVGEAFLTTRFQIVRLSYECTVHNASFLLHSINQMLFARRLVIGVPISNGDP